MTEPEMFWLRLDKMATVVEKTVTESQQRLPSTVTNLLLQTVPTRPDIGEQVGMEFFKTVMADPTKDREITQTIQAVAEAFKEQEIQDDKR